MSSICLSEAEFHLLNHIEMVKDVLEAAVVGQAIKERTDGIFGLHGFHLSRPEDSASLRPAA